MSMSSRSLVFPQADHVRRDCHDNILARRRPPTLYRVTAVHVYITMRLMMKRKRVFKTRSTCGLYRAIHRNCGCKCDNSSLPVSTSIMLLAIHVKPKKTSYSFELTLRASTSIISRALCARIFQLLQTQPSSLQTSVKMRPPL